MIVGRVGLRTTHGALPVGCCIRVRVFSLLEMMTPSLQSPHRVPLLALILAGAHACTAGSGDDGESERVASLTQAFVEADTEPNDNAGSSQALKAVDLVTGTVVSGDPDWFLTSGRTAEEVYAYVDGFNDTELNLYSSFNPLIPFASDSDSGPGLDPAIAGVTLPVMSNEFMYLEVDSNSGNSAGYTLHSYVADPSKFQDEVEPNDSVAAAEPIAMPKVRGSIGALGEQDWFSFPAKNGDAIALIVNNDRLGNGVVRSHISLHNNIGGQLAIGSTSTSDSGSAANAIAGTATYDGMFAVRVQSASPNVSGEYEFVVLVDGRPVVLTTQSESASSGTIGTADGLRSQHVGEGSLALAEHDYWRIVGGPSDRVYAYLNADTNGVSLGLRNPADISIEGDTHDGPSGGAAIAGAVTLDKMSFLRVSDTDDNNPISDYQLFVGVFDPADVDDHGNPFAPTIANAQALTAIRNRANLVFSDTDYFAFEANAGETVVVIVDEDPDDLPAGLDLSIDLRDGADAILAVGDNSIPDSNNPGNAVGPIAIPQTGTYYLRVANDDTTSAALGAYEFVVLRSLGPVICGDGDVDGQETCDDANLVSGDGCDATCVEETGYACNNEPSVCNEVCGDGLIVGGEACDQTGLPPQSGDGCSFNCQLENGWSCTGMPSICGPVCGDGIIAGGETCDDGNTVSLDGCTSTCSAFESGWSCGGQPTQCSPICGDGQVVAGEVCDDSNTTAGDGCNASCAAVESGWNCPSGGGACTAICGDSVTVGGEPCDDGNTNAGDGCNATCGAVESGWSCPSSGGSCSAICGDGVTVGSEACDDSNTSASDGCDCGTVESGWSCPSGGGACSANCGDNLVVGGEVCDDGNVMAGDGCSIDCGSVEPGWTCPSPPMSGACSSNCGDGLIVGSEACDDMNTTAGDGCDASCAVEAGFSCSGEPSVCTPGCGDGLVAGGEACDDGNASDGDGCSATCEVETGYSCAGDPSICDAVCGDGMIVGSEGCDDANTTAGDGCDDGCAVEAGYSCSGEPSQCTEDGGTGGMGAGGEGMGGSGGDGAGPSTGGSDTTGGGTTGGGSATDSGGCSYSAQGRSANDAGAWGALLGLGLMWRRRRRRHGLES
jgi:cysteine-rich repeat protein